MRIAVIVQMTTSGSIRSRSLMAEKPFPAAGQYDGFWQIDNAIGLSVRLRDTWREELEFATEAGELPLQPLTVLTGELATKAWLREFTPVFEATDAPPVEVVGVENRFYGNSVTVAGLLSGQDLRRALLRLPREPKRTVILSQRVLNSDGLTLDGMELVDIAKEQPHTVVVGEEDRRDLQAAAGEDSEDRPGLAGIDDRHGLGV